MSTVTASSLTPPPVQSTLQETSPNYFLSDRALDYTLCAISLFSGAFGLDSHGPLTLIGCGLGIAARLVAEDNAEGSVLKGLKGTILCRDLSDNPESASARRAHFPAMLCLSALALTSASLACRNPSPLLLSCVYLGYQGASNGFYPALQKAVNYGGGHANLHTNLA